MVLNPSCRYISTYEDRLCVYNYIISEYINVKPLKSYKSRWEVPFSPGASLCVLILILIWGPAEGSTRAVLGQHSMRGIED